MKHLKFFLLVCVSVFAASCSNELDELTTSNLDLQTRSIEPRFVGENITEYQAIALMNKFLDAPDFFYFEDVIGFDPEVAICASNFSVSRNGSTIHVRSIDVGVIGKQDRYGVYGKPTTSKEFYTSDGSTVLHGEPIYEDTDVERANPVGMRYYYTTNDRNHSQNCWIAINWEDAPAFEKIIGW